MNQDQVQEFADGNSLDVRIMGTGRHEKPNHMRLMDEWGNYVVDIYFKCTKGGALRGINKVFRHNGQRWGEIINANELKKFITQ